MLLRKGEGDRSRRGPLGDEKGNDLESPNSAIATYNRQTYRYCTYYWAKVLLKFLDCIRNFRQKRVFIVIF